MSESIFSQYDTAHCDSFLYYTVKHWQTDKQFEVR